VDKLFEHLPAIISAAAQSYLGILALLAVALSVLAYFFFARASEKARVGIFVLLFLGVAGFGVAMFRAAPAGPLATPTALSKEAKTLLKQASQDPSGLVLYEKFGAGVDLHTNGVSLVTSKADHQGLARWEAALEELTRQGLLKARGTAGEIWEITAQGYDFARKADVASDLPAQSAAPRNPP
jgi:hypothetical protein